MSHPLEVSVGSKVAFSAPPRNNSKQTSREEYNNTPELTAVQQRKIDALDMAELIYAIYNKNCPIIELNRNDRGKNDN